MGALLSIISFLTSPVGRWVGAAAGVGIALGVAYWKGDSNGYARAIAKVEAQQKRAISLATKAREQLTRACARDSEACVPEEWFRDEE
jgi:hypothetical protein